MRYGHLEKMGFYHMIQGCMFITHNFIWPTHFPNALNCQHIFDGSHRMLHNSLEVSRLHFKRLNNNLHGFSKRVNSGQKGS